MRCTVWHPLVCRGLGEKCSTFAFFITAPHRGVLIQVAATISDSVALQGGCGSGTVGKVQACDREERQGVAGHGAPGEHSP